MEVRKTFFVFISLILVIPCQAKIITVDDDEPADFNNIQTAINHSNIGDTIRVGSGTYNERLSLYKSISLVGEDSNTCILEGNGIASGGIVATVSDSVYIGGFTIRDVKTGIFVTSGASLKIEDCNITECDDGIGFTDSFNTTLFMRNCVISRNIDGVDLESTQGVILSSQFVANRDDGLDYDGDCGVLVYACTFIDNSDDGIEIRIARRTHAIILDCLFEGNGEDGIEIINSPTAGNVYNLFCVQNCSFSNNIRYGVGFVAHDTEEHTGEMSKTAVYAVGNTFANTGVGDVSPNYIPVFNAPQTYPATVEARIQRPGEADIVSEVMVQIPLLVGIYNLYPTTDGTRIWDAEGVTVWGNKIYVADDNSDAIFVLDRATGEVVEAIPTNPFPGEGDSNALSPEGLDIVLDDGNDVLLLSDDDGMSLWTLSLEEASLGRVLRHQDTSPLAAEGVEQVGDQLILADGYNKLYRVDANDLEETGECTTLLFDANFGTHIAGVGADEEGDHVFLTLSAYQDEQIRNHKSAFFEMDPALTEIQGFWHLGPFSNDPRGIASSDGLIYVADGRSHFVDTETGEVNRGGIKVFVFLLEDNPQTFNKALPFLPIRCPAPVHLASTADINDDGVVNFEDFTILAINWHKNIGDISGDGVVDFNDVDMLVDNWLKTGKWMWWR